MHMEVDVGSTPNRRDVGQAAAVVVMAVSAVFASTAMALSTMGSGLVDRTRAQTAADAVALASLVAGRTSGVALADRHGATVVSWTSHDDGDGRAVEVVIRLGGATATARATDRP
jgi:hypothetical protein